MSVTKVDSSQQLVRVLLALVALVVLSVILLSYFYFVGEETFGWFWPVVAAFAAYAYFVRYLVFPYVRYALQVLLMLPAIVHKYPTELLGASLNRANHKPINLIR